VRGDERLGPTNSLQEDDQPGGAASKSGVPACHQRTNSPMARRVRLMTQPKTLREPADDPWCSSTLELQPIALTANRIA